MARPDSLRYRSAAQRRLIAYARLGVEPWRVAEAPRITPFLDKLFGSRGGIATALDYLRGYDHDDARRFLARYDDLTLSRTLRDLLPLEAFALAAGLTPPRLRELIVLATMQVGGHEGAIIAALDHPDNVQRTIANSSLPGPDGAKDREMLHKHSQFLPTPRGAQVNVHNTVQASATAVAQSTAISVPKPENTIRRLTDRFNTSHAPTQMPSASERFLPPAPTIEVVPERMPYQTDTRDLEYIDADYASDGDDATGDD